MQPRRPPASRHPPCATRGCTAHRAAAKPPPSVICHSSLWGVVWLQGLRRNIIPLPPRALTRSAAAARGCSRVGPVQQVLRAAHIG